MIEGSGILPSLPKSEVEICNCRSMYLELQVVPRGTGTIAMVELDQLVVSIVPGIITPTVGEIDPSDECDITLGRGRVADDHELLVVRTASSHSLVKQYLAAGRAYLDGEVAVLFRAESQPVAVRSPEESTHVYTSPAEVCHESRYGRPTICHQLIAISPPVREAHHVPGPKIG
ncbi:MAG: hypothetical protein ACYDBS_05595, partial [Acidimicrobiales bacterium]